MAIVDAHVHLYPPEVAADPAGWASRAGERHWALLCTRKRRDGRPVQELPTIGGLLASMDAAGIDRAVLLGWYWESMATCIWQNRFYAECVRAHPDRIAACATVHVSAGREALLDELSRCEAEGLVGLGELSPHSQGYACGDPLFQEVLAWAAAHRWPVNLHVTDPDSRPFPGRIDTPLADFSRLARAHPQTTFVLAHWGGLLPFRDASIATLPNVFFDTAASPLLYDARIWRRFAAAVPASRVLFGSDYPLNLYPQVSVAAEMTKFVLEAKAAGSSAQILGENAQRLFGAAASGAPP